MRVLRTKGINNHRLDLYMTSGQNPTKAIVYAIPAYLDTKYCYIVIAGTLYSVHVVSIPKRFHCM